MHIIYLNQIFHYSKLYKWLNSFVIRTESRLVSSTGSQLAKRLCCWPVNNSQQKATVARTLRWLLIPLTLFLVTGGANGAWQRGPLKGGTGGCSCDWATDWTDKNAMYGGVRDDSSWYSILLNGNCFRLQEGRSSLLLSLATACCCRCTKYRQCRYIVTLRQICATTVTVEKKCVTYSECVFCVCSLRHPTCNAHAPYCHLWPARHYSIFPHYLINGTIFREKKLLNTKCGLWLSVQLLYDTFCMIRFVWYILYDAFCMIHFVWCILYDTFCMIHFVWYILYDAFCMMHFVWYIFILRRIERDVQETCNCSTDFLKITKYQIS
jgi:hypothetical protein